MSIKNQTQKSTEQDGFSLLELLVVITIMGVVVPAVGASVYQITRGTQSSNNRMAAINSVQRAGEYISSDVRQSQVALGYGDTNGFPLNITWTEFTLNGTGNSTLVEYDYSSSNQTLTRNYSFTSGGTTTNSTIVVARNITEIKCTPIKTNGQVNTVELVANSTFTDPYTGQPATESRTFEIRPRTLD